MTKGAEMRTLTSGLVYNFQFAQRAVERAMLGVSFVEKIPSEIIRQRTKVADTM